MGRACATSIGGGRRARSVGSPGWSRRRMDGPSGKRGRDTGDARPDRFAQVGSRRELRPWRLDVGNGVRRRAVRLVEEPGAGAARDPSPRRRPQDVACRRRYAWKSVHRPLPPVGSTSTRWWARLGCRWRSGTGCRTRCCATSWRRFPASQRSASVGGTTEQILIESDAERLRARNLAFSDVVGSRASEHQRQSRSLEDRDRASAPRQPHEAAARRRRPHGAHPGHADRHHRPGR